MSESSHKKLKILYVSNSAKPGGMEMHLLELCRGMVSRGHDVYLWCPPGDLAERVEEVGAKVSLAKINLEVDFIYIFRLILFIKRHGIDVVHAHEVKSVSNAVIAAFIAGVRVRISHTHTPISTWKIGAVNKCLNLIADFLVVNLLSSKEIALTESVRSQKIKEGLLKTKLIVIPNGLPIEPYLVNSAQRASFNLEIRDRFSIPKNHFVIGNTSRLTLEKGNSQLVSAFAKSNISDSTLLLAGGGEELARLKQQVEHEKISERVIFTDYYVETDKVKFLCAMDLLCFPSYAEGFGFVPLEALLVGTPVLVSDLPVLKDVLKEHATYFEVGSIESLGQGIAKFYSKTRLVQSDLLEKAQQFIKLNYTLDSFINAYERLYLSLL